MRLNITLTDFKLWQDFPPGTWAHEDWYTGPRSTNERVNSLLKRKHGGTDLERGAIAPRRASTYGLFVAFAIAVTNRRVIETWDRDTKHGIPAPPGYERARQRERILRNLSRKVA